MTEDEAIELMEDRRLDGQIEDYMQAKWEEAHGINQPPPVLTEVEEGDPNA